MKFILLFFLLYWIAGDQTQTNGKITDCKYYYNESLRKQVYTIVEVEPEFPGGAAAYMRYINKYLRNLEDSVDDLTSLPIPSMKFIVDTDGQIVNPGIQGKNDTTNLNSLERATLQIIKKMPQWVPAMCNGKKVAAEVTRPLAICIRWEEE